MRNAGFSESCMYLINLVELVGRSSVKRMTLG
jgi:hypothetical protein